MSSLLTARAVSAPNIELALPESWRTLLSKYRSTLHPAIRFKLLALSACGLLSSLSLQPSYAFAQVSNDSASESQATTAADDSSIPAEQKSQLLHQRMTLLEQELKRLRLKIECQKQAPQDAKPALKAQDERDDDDAEENKKRQLKNYYDANARPLPLEVMPATLAGFRFHGYLRAGVGVT